MTSLVLFFNYMLEVILATDTLQFDSRSVPKSSRPHQDNVVFLEIVSLTWHISNHVFPCCEPYQHTPGKRDERQIDTIS